MGDFGVRKYDDGLGRFMSIDPLWEKYRSLSPYHYGENNPLKLIDPSGMVAEEKNAIQKDDSKKIQQQQEEAYVKGMTGVIAGSIGMVIAAGLMAVPGGQLAGLVLFSLSFTAAGLGASNVMEATISTMEDRSPNSIPGGVGEAFGGAIDKTIGGEGVYGANAGSILETIVTAFLGKAGGAPYIPRLRDVGDPVVWVGEVGKSTGLDALSVIQNSVSIIDKATKKPPTNNAGIPGVTAPRMSETLY